MFKIKLCNIICFLWKGFLMINKKKFCLKKLDYLILLIWLMGSDYLCKVNKKRNLDYFLGKFYSILLLYNISWY